MNRRWCRPGIPLWRLRNPEHLREHPQPYCRSIRIKNFKPILDEIDTVLAEHYGFTAEELDFILNYDLKYRLGRGAGEEE